MVVPGAAQVGTGDWLDNVVLCQCTVCGVGRVFRRLRVTLPGAVRLAFALQCVVHTHELPSCWEVL
jgi:predicted RNA-binding protein with PUA domain